MAYFHRGIKQQDCMLEASWLTLGMSAFRVPPLSASDESRKSCTVGMASMILTLLSSAWFPLDLSAHQDALILAGNLLAGTGRDRLPDLVLICGGGVLRLQGHDCYFGGQLVL